MTQFTLPEDGVDKYVILTFKERQQWIQNLISTFALDGIEISEQLAAAAIDKTCMQRLWMEMDENSSVDAKFDGLIEGRFVHYVVPRTPEPHPHRTAIVVRVWDRNTGYVNLQVFTDGENDGEWGAGNVVWATSVPYSEEPNPSTWHWPERASDE